MKRFKFIRVDFSDTRMMDQIYRLRYQVYCRERGFIKEQDHPDGMDKDELDAQSLHFVAVNSFNEVVGSIRMILPGKIDLPVEKFCSDIMLPDKSSSGIKYAEISRLVISKMLMRKNTYIKHFIQPVVNESNKYVRDFAKISSPIALGLYRELYLESMRRGIENWYTLMEKSLWVLLLKHNFDCACIGGEVDYYGIVKPYLVKLKKHNGKVHV